MHDFEDDNVICCFQYEIIRRSHCMSKTSKKRMCGFASLVRQLDSGGGQHVPVFVTPNSRGTLHVLPTHPPDTTLKNLLVRLSVDLCRHHRHQQ